MLPYINFSLKSGYRLLSYGQKIIFICRLSAILNFKKMSYLISDCHRVPNLHLCTKFHQNRIIFRCDQAIVRFAIWRPSAEIQSLCHVTSIAMLFCVTYNGGLDPLVANDFNFI